MVPIDGIDPLNDPLWGLREHLQADGFPAAHEAEPKIRAKLDFQIKLETMEMGDHELIRLLCRQLFSLGSTDHTLPIWRVKNMNFDTMNLIDVECLCGGGLEETKAYLTRLSDDPDACAALEYILRCEDCGDFADFTPAAYVSQCRAEYGLK